MIYQTNKLKVPISYNSKYASFSFQKMVERLIKHWQLYSKVNNTNTNFKKIDWQEFLKNNSAFIKDFDFVKDMAVEDPGDSPVISASFGAHVLPVNATDFLPFFGTDFGFCSLIKPQLNFNVNYSSFPFSTKLFGPKRKNESYSRQIKPGRWYLLKVV